ncbi:MAG: crotonase/enoyl-CoA hydratase family protein [Rhodoferax sp.]|uniref:crotonase/enoyl-CoA hydratase family protein n=1 Tax=Rhodoferax sp. TaxID=50421 RepID=UPI0008D5803D|nr:crotonase/enoyl-CoA hydratase family protein [Rhodoferax sp.]MDP2678823.1 crotonase/enoyl-CoA hydratase family protein [Rhodoferax sp.]OGB53157.1 MAG: enoyl-CoA hydratase [Burkholderiales bacterium RIFOXYD12_FULL_59_19]
MNDPILCELRGPVALLTLNRPDTRNALSGEAMFAAFEQLFERLNADLSVGVAVLTGAGSAFCSGGNVAEMRNRSGMFGGSPEQIAVNYRVGIQRIPRAFQGLHVPIIAAVNGAAIGAGNDLACMCDIRIASSTARFAESFVKVGIVPGDGGCWLLPRVVGMSRAAELALTGDTIDADEALRMGLVSRVVAPEALMIEAMKLADRIAANPPQVLRWTKQLLQQARTGSLDEALDTAGRFQGLAHHTADHTEAVTAFFEKRTPVFGR